MNDLSEIVYVSSHSQVVLNVSI